MLKIKIKKVYAETRSFSFVGYQISCRRMKGVVPKRQPSPTKLFNATTSGQNFLWWITNTRVASWKTDWKELLELLSLDKSISKWSCLQMVYKHAPL